MDITRFQESLRKELCKFEGRGGGSPVDLSPRAGEKPAAIYIIGNAGLREMYPIHHISQGPNGELLIVALKEEQEKGFSCSIGLT